MTIYFNQHYSNRPYLNDREQSCFNTLYCGTEGLLSVLMLHGGIAGPMLSAEERKAAYHNNMLKKIGSKHMFYRSFALDSFTAGSAVLAWRDALVAVGWDMKCGDSPKLRFLCEMEPENMPRGEADCWRDVLKISCERTLLPVGSEIIVTQEKALLEPKIAALFDKLQRMGTKVCYQPDKAVLAEGNLGKLQKWLHNDRQGAIDIAAADDTLELLHFRNDDEAMRYIATQPADRWQLYCCRQPKLFDNILRMLGQPVCGSGLVPCEPQVIQLFTLGNGLFEYPLNLHRILAWLNAPVNPLGKGLSRKLANVIAASGGIGNNEWDAAWNEYLDSQGDNEKARKEAKRKKEIFLPLGKSENTDIAAVESFNKALCAWANSVLAMATFPYDDIVREQLSQIDVYCKTLLNILREYGGKTISFIELQGWCRSIVARRSYAQYEPETGCRNTIAEEGDIHSETDSMVWFCIEDSQRMAYPYDFLTEAEYNTLADNGVYLYDKSQHVKMRHDAMVQMLSRTRRLTLVETDKIGGESVQRHPLMLQLQASANCNLDMMIRHPEMPVESLDRQSRVDNSSGELILQLEEGVVPPERWEKGHAESYTSLDMLIQHPFDYLCRYCASLDDINVPTMSDKNRTMGNVAHLMIEKVFKGTTRKEQGRLIREEYGRIFKEAVDSAGLLLRQPEYAIELRNMEVDMKKVLEWLWQIIFNNGLEVYDCELLFDTYNWTAVSDKVKLESRADMLLTDKQGNKVIFDFKWSSSRKHKQSIEGNAALQLAIYKRLAENQFGCSVRTAYIQLPSMEFISGDVFDDNTPVQYEPLVDIMTLAANGYAYRRCQFSEGRIERAEGVASENSEYGAAQEQARLFPLEICEKKICENRYTDFKKLR